MGRAWEGGRDREGVEYCDRRLLDANDMGRDTAFGRAGGEVAACEGGLVVLLLLLLSSLGADAAGLVLSSGDVTGGASVAIVSRSSAHHYPNAKCVVEFVRMYQGARTTCWMGTTSDGWLQLLRQRRSGVW